MKYAIFTLFVVLLLAGCQAEKMPETGQNQEVSPEETAEETAKSGETAAAEEIPPAPVENIPQRPEKGIKLEKVCEKLLTAKEFETECNSSVELIPKISGNTCWVNIRDKKNPKLTAGFTVVDWKKEGEADREFERGVSMRRTQGAEETQKVGERAYEYQQIERHNIVWVNGKFLSSLGAMNELCPAENLVEVAKDINARLG